MSVNFDKWIESAKQKGISTLEISASKSESLAIKIYEGTLEKATKSSVDSYAFKGIYRNKASEVSFEDASDANVDKVLDFLVENAKIVTSTEPAIIYKGAAKYKEIPDSTTDFDSVSLDRKIELVKQLESRIKQDKLVYKFEELSYHEAGSQYTLVNSKGLNLSRKTKYAYLVVALVIKKGDEIVSAFSIEPAHNFVDFDVNAIAKKVLKEGKDQLGYQGVTSGDYEIVVRNEQVADVFHVFQSNFSLQSAVRNTTLLKGKIGTKIAVDFLNLYDDPMSNKAFEKVNFDDEGYPTKLTPIIKDGVFTGFLNNLKFAKMEKVKPTGHGDSCYPHNLSIKPGKSSFNELISKVKKGIYVTEFKGLHVAANPQSGDFSFPASGFLIENGKIGVPVKLFVVSGNFYELLNNIKEIGKDAKHLVMSSSTVPTINFGKLRVAGK